MKLSELERSIISLSVEQWNKTFGGIDSLELARKIQLSNEKIMEAIEGLVFKQIGTMNANAEFFVIRIDSDNANFDIDDKHIIAHVFFPPIEALESYYYSSNLVRSNFPEYKRRLHLGEHQLGQVFFDEAVLSRYFDYPEYYEVDDSRSGGRISISSDQTPDEKYLDVRHGKKVLSNGRSLVVAIFKDLSRMSEQEQRHWHAHELDVKDMDFEINDKAYQKFIDRNYYGACINYENDLLELEQQLKEFNGCFNINIFNQTENIYCRPPTENTNKAFFDSCSELFKIVGSDNINQKALKFFLIESKSCGEDDFLHESGRPLSAIQLFELLEKKVNVQNNFSKAVRSLQKDRTAADHKIIKPEINDGNKVEDFFGHCKALTSALKNIVLEIKRNPL